MSARGRHLDGVWIRLMVVLVASTALTALSPRTLNNLLKFWISSMSVGEPSR